MAENLDPEVKSQSNEIETLDSKCPTGPLESRWTNTVHMQNL